MLSNRHLSLHGPSKASTIFFASSLLLMAATIVFSNISWGGEYSMPLRLWHWVGPIKLSGGLVVAAGLLMCRHPLASVAAILISSYAVYDVGLGVFEAWHGHEGLRRMVFLEVFLRESLFPIWKGLLRGVLGILFVIYGAVRLFRNPPSGRVVLR